MRALGEPSVNGFLIMTSTELARAYPPVKEKAPLVTLLDTVNTQVFEIVSLKG